MVITAQTRWDELQLVIGELADGELERLKEIAPRAVIGGDGYYGITIGQLAAIVEHDDARPIVGDMSEPTAFEMLTLQGLSAFVQSYIDRLAALTVPASAEEKEAAAKCMQVGMIEGLLSFARDWFRLQMYKDAESVTLGELLMAKKEAYNRGLFQRAYSSAMQRAANKRGGR